MYDIALSTATHDLLLNDKNDLVLITGPDRVAQQIKIALLTWLGEWFLDSTVGVPYLERILKKNPNLAQIKNILRAKIKAVADVKSVVSVSVIFDQQKRNLTVNYEVETTFGSNVSNSEVLSYG